MKTKKQRAAKVYGVWHAGEYRSTAESLYGCLHRTPRAAVAHAKLLIQTKFSGFWKWKRVRVDPSLKYTFALWYAHDPKTGERRLPYQPVIIRVHNLVR